MSQSKHMNRQGSTRSSALMQEAAAIGLWMERHLSSLRAENISGSSHIQADWLSRKSINQAEWKLHPDVICQLSTRFGPSQVDLFASPENAQLPWFYTKFQSPGAEGTDALCCPWPQGVLYVFSAMPLIPRVIRKILEEDADVLLIAPHWSRQNWFVDLLTLSISPPWRIPPDRISLSQGAALNLDP